MKTRLSFSTLEPHLAFSRRPIGFSSGAGGWVWASEAGSMDEVAVAVDSTVVVMWTSAPETAVKIIILDGG